MSGAEEDLKQRRIVEIRWKMDFSNEKKMRKIMNRFFVTRKKYSVPEELLKG